jgi:hypothetical protein
VLGKNGIKVFDHIFPHKLTLTFLGDHYLTPCIFSSRLVVKDEKKRSGDVFWNMHIKKLNNLASVLNLNSKFIKSSSAGTY